MKPCRLLLVLIFFCASAFGQDSTGFTWSAKSVRTGAGEYRLEISVTQARDWQIYGPGQDISGTRSMEMSFRDSALRIDTLTGSGKSAVVASPIFDGQKFTVYPGAATVAGTIKIHGDIPAVLPGTLNFAYGKNDQFYTGSFAFAVPLEGGKTTGRIRIASIDVNHPASPCGDETTAGKGLLSIFLLGLVGGFIGLLTPCVFPLIPLTVSFFTKAGGGGRRGVGQALLYGFFIFAIYILLSLPFHLLDRLDPGILNNISTNIWLNLFFFVIFIVFAISFFGYFEISLPGAVATSVDSKSGRSSFVGIFFMALTLAIVSFSCTGPILGSLLAGAFSSSGGAWQLTFGMGGFGLGLALPFALFALFPGWLTSLPKSGGWLTSVKVVLGFLELAMALKFLSNADLVKQWHILPREVFIGIWVVIGIMIVLYLMGRIRFPHDGPVTSFGSTRIAFIALFAVATIYLAPGVTNTVWGRLGLISGFPPPLCYSVYKDPVNCARGVEPMRDYTAALALARKEHKPLLIDFTGWACVNCRRMEENVWTDPAVRELMTQKFVVVSLYVDERRALPLADQSVYTTKTGAAKEIITVGDKWATFQSENFNAVSQPQYAILSGDEKVLTRTKGYTPSAREYADWLQCGLQAESGEGQH